MKYKVDDLDKVTASDYTVQFLMSPEQFTTFKLDYFDETSKIPLIMQLEIYIRDEMEKRIAELYNISTEQYTQVFTETDLRKSDSVQSYLASRRYSRMNESNVT